MKKTLAVLLATVMLLSVCAVSVCADSVVTEHDFSTNQPGQMFDYYVTGEITVEGWADPEFNMGKNIFYGVTIVNHTKNEVVYTGHIQSVATFSDETFDVDHCSYSVTLVEKAKDDVSQIHFLPYGKTLISFDEEFRVYSSGYLKWEGLLSHTYTPGIDL